MSEPSPAEPIVPLSPIKKVRKVIIKKPKLELNANIKIEDPYHKKETNIINKKTSKLEKLKLYICHIQM